MTILTVSFSEIVANHFATLDLYTTAITRAHGKSHPEAYRVRELFTQMQQKIEASGAEQANLDEEFQELRQVTNNYTIPADVCGTYASVYQILSEADRAYHQ